MSCLEFRSIAEFIEPVMSWNPLRENPAKNFQYIDLSAVDQDEKRITGAREIICADAPSRARQIVKSGDILVSTVRPNLNGVAKVPVELDSATASTGFCVLRTKQALLNSSYLFHWVKSPQFVSDMVKKATGASYPAVSDKIITTSLLPYVPVSEQRRIAEFLDQADELCAKRRETLAQLDALTQSIFIEMFGNPISNSKGLPIRKLAEITEFENGDRSSNYPSGEEIKDSGILFLSTKNISNGHIDLSSYRSYISKEKFQSLSRGKVRNKDLLITLRGTLGSCCIFDCEYDTAFINAQMMIIRPKSEIRPVYLHALLTSNYYQDLFIQIGQGAAVPQLTATQLSQLKIILPSLVDQIEFEKKIEAVKKIKNTQGKSSSKSNALFLALQYQAFRGDL